MRSIVGESKIYGRGKMKYCIGCNAWVHVASFSRDIQTEDKLSRYCKCCVSLKRQKMYRESTEGRVAIRDSVLKYKYGITKEEYEALLKVQNNRCSICGKTPEENKKLLAVDHDHDTNKNRGLLCTACNMGLGYFRDNKELLNKAIEYLEEWE